MDKCRNCPLTPDICHGEKPDCDIRDDEIMASWDAHDDDDISTERLLEMVADDCKCEVDDVVETLSRQQDRIEGEQG